MFSTNFRIVFLCVLGSLCLGWTSASEVQNCGEALTDIMSIVCKAQAAQGQYSKRSGYLINLRNDDRPFYASIPFALQMLTTLSADRHSHTSDLDRRVRRSPGMNDYYVHHGITDECCDQPCTYETMASYCGTYI